MLEILEQAFWLTATQLISWIPIVFGIRMIFQWIADLLFTKA